MARIYTSRPLSSGQSIDLEAGPSHHLAGALRLTAGDSFTVFNGAAGEYPATIESVGKKSLTVRLGKRIDRSSESTLRIHLGIAISRSDRMDWIVQKSTELGVAKVTPLFTERSTVKLKGERARKKLNHWRQIAISACEQCGRNQLPQIAPVVQLEQWLKRDLPEQRFVLDHRSGHSVAELGQNASAIALLIGPEGGLAEAEIASALTQKFSALTLGPRVLRTETAPLAAIAILQARWGDMN